MPEDEPTDDPPDPAVTNNIAQNVARMTFSTGSQAHSGFSPEKVTDSQASADTDRTKVNSAKKDLNSVLNVPDKRTGVLQSKLDSSSSSSGSKTGGDGAEGAVGGPVVQMSTPKKESSGFGLQAPPLHKSASK